MNVFVGHGGTSSPGAKQRTAPMVSCLMVGIDLSFTCYHICLQISAVISKDTLISTVATYMYIYMHCDGDITYVQFNYGYNIKVICITIISFLSLFLSFFFLLIAPTAYEIPWPGIKSEPQLQQDQILEHNAVRPEIEPKCPQQPKPLQLDS